MARTAQHHSSPVSRRLRTGMRRAGSSALAGAASLAAIGLIAPAASADGHNVWDRVAQCESGGDWDINTGNGFYGGLQFWHPTWKGFGGQEFAPYAHQATKLQQITVAQRVLRVQGPGAWPVCSVRAGLNMQNGLEPYPGDDPAPPPPPPPPGEPVDTWWVSANYAANIRSGPGLGYAVVGSAPRGTQVSGTASNGWVRLSDGRGWISLSVLTTEEPGRPAPPPPPAPEPPPGDTDSWIVSANYAANIRSGPGLGYGVVGSAPRGTQVSGTVSNGWVRLSDGRGWISLVVLTPADDPGTPAPPPPGDGDTWRVSVSVGANIRSGPGTGYAVIGGVGHGTQVSGELHSNGWVKLSGRDGWISGNILTRVG